MQETDATSGGSTRPSAQSLTFGGPGVALIAAAMAGLVFLTGTLTRAAIIAGVVCAAIVVHEGAHALTARAAGENVTEIAVGFGPPAVQLRAGSVTLSLRGLLLGGSTDVPGINNLGAARTAAIAAAGPLASGVFALAAGLAAYLGATIDPPASAVFSEIVESRPADNAADYRIERLDRSAGVVHADVSYFTQDGQLAETKTVTVPMRQIPAGEAWDRTVAMSSPRLIVEARTETDRQLPAWRQALLSAGKLSAVLAWFNLLPVFPLDGGRIVVAAAEACSRRRLSDVGRGALASAGTLVVVGLSLMLIVT